MEKLRHRWLRVGLVWLLGPWLARPILRRGHAACLKRLRLLEWQVIEKPAMERQRQEAFERHRRREALIEANDRLDWLARSYEQTTGRKRSWPGEHEHVEWLGPNGRFQ